MNLWERRKLWISFYTYLMRAVVLHNNVGSVWMATLWQLVWYSRHVQISIGHDLANYVLLADPIIFFYFFLRMQWIISYWWSERYEHQRIAYKYRLENVNESMNYEYCSLTPTIMWNDICKLIYSLLNIRNEKVAMLHYRPRMSWML